METYKKEVEKEVEKYTKDLEKYKEEQKKYKKALRNYEKALKNKERILFWELIFVESVPNAYHSFNGLSYYEKDELSYYSAREIDVADAHNYKLVILFHHENAGIYYYPFSVTDEDEIQSSIYKVENLIKQYKSSLSSSRSYLTLLLLILFLPIFSFLHSCLKLIWTYLKSRKTYFQIQYAGGMIAFDVSFYAKAEIDDFQKQLRRVKDLYEQNADTSKEIISAIQQTTQQPVAAAQTEPSVTSPADELRKYADMLKEGLIIQEEYDAIKRKFWGCRWRYGIIADF